MRNGPGRRAEPNPHLLGFSSRPFSNQRCPSPAVTLPATQHKYAALRARIAPGLVLPIHPNPPKTVVYRRGFSSWPELDALGCAPERLLGDGGCVEMLPVGLQL